MSANFIRVLNSVWANHKVTPQLVFFLFFPMILRKAEHRSSNTAWSPWLELLAPGLVPLVYGCPNGARTWLDGVWRRVVLSDVSSANIKRIALTRICIPCKTSIIPISCTHVETCWICWVGGYNTTPYSFLHYCCCQLYTDFYFVCNRIIYVSVLTLPCTSLADLWQIFNRYVFCIPHAYKTSSLKLYTLSHTLRVTN
jgi:hypothetical protein